MGSGVVIPWIITQNESEGDEKGVQDHLGSQQRSEKRVGGGEKEGIGVGTIKEARGCPRRQYFGEAETIRTSSRQEDYESSVMKEMGGRGRKKYCSKTSDWYVKTEGGGEK